MDGERERREGRDGGKEAGIEKERGREVRKGQSEGGSVGRRVG